VRRLAARPSEGTEIAVLDASAALAFLHREPGFERILDVLHQGRMSTVNLAEVCAKSVDRGIDPVAVAGRLEAVGVLMEPFLEGDAISAASMLPRTRRLGLSLADRACLALGLRLGRPVLATDGALAEADVGVDVILIR
jgi:ribonuclease VapC